MCRLFNPFCILLVLNCFAVRVATAQIQWDGKVVLGDAVASNFVDQGEFTGLDIKGSDLWDTSDNGYFVYKELSGAFGIKGEIFTLPLDEENAAPKVGLMVRNNLTPGSSNGFAFTTGDIQQEGIGFFGGQVDFTSQWRHLQDGHSSREAGFGASGKVISVSQIFNAGLMEVERFGNTIYFYYYDLDESRILLNSVELPDLVDPVYVGLVATSGNPESLIEAAFYNVEIKELPFSAVRSLPQEPFKSKEVIPVKIDLNFHANATGDITVTETLPAGWSLISSDPAAIVSGQQFSWNVNAGAGQSTLKYELKAPDKARLSANLTGEVTQRDIVGVIGGNSRLQIFIPFVHGMLDEFDDGDIGVNMNGTGNGFRNVSQGNEVVEELDGAMVIQSSGWNFGRVIGDKDAFNFWNPDGIDIEMVLNSTSLFDANPNQAYRGMQVGIVSSRILEVFEPENPEHSAFGVDPEHNTVGSIYVAITDNVGGAPNGAADLYFAIDGLNVPDPDNSAVVSQTLARIEFPDWNPQSSDTPLIVRIHLSSNGYELEFNEPFDDIMGAGISGSFPEGAFPNEFLFGGYLFMGLQYPQNDGKAIVDKLEVTHRESAPPAPTLNIRFEGENVIVEWTGGTLETASTIDGPYMDAGKTSPLVWTPADLLEMQMQFARVRAE
jgi:hypothetical protein